LTPGPDSLEDLRLHFQVTNAPKTLAAGLRPDPLQWVPWKGTLSRSFAVRKRVVEAEMNEKGYF
jgi:hypothetical protein